MELDYEFMQKTFFELWRGAEVTVSLTLITLILAIPPAFYFSVRRLHGNVVERGFVRSYISLVRGTPILLQILVLYSLLPSLLQSLVNMAGLAWNIFETVDPFYYAVFIFTVNTTALMTEVFRSALLAIPKGQLEAGLASGLTARQTYLRVILPQALVVALPSISNVTVNLIKGTSLAFLMTVQDVMAVGKVAASFGYNYIEAYIDVFLVYLILCSLVQYLYRMAEARLGAFR